MAIIYETPSFSIESADQPHIDREDGGHIRVMPKQKVEDRTKLTPELAKELMKLTMVTGEAMKIALNKQGIDVMRINYQENGNWVPILHIHLYGRATSAKIQKYGEAMHLPQRSTGFYDSFKPLTSQDIQLIKEEINRLLQTSKYKNF